MDLDNISYHRLKIFEEIDDIVTFGPGYDWLTVYEMPLWLKRFTYKRKEQILKNRLEQKNSNLGGDALTDKLKKIQSETSDLQTVYKSKTKK